MSAARTALLALAIAGTLAAAAAWSQAGTASSLGAIVRTAAWDAQILHPQAPTASEQAIVDACQRSAACRHHVAGGVMATPADMAAAIEAARQRTANDRRP